MVVQIPNPTEGKSLPAMVLACDGNELNKHAFDCKAPEMRPSKGSAPAANGLSKPDLERATDGATVHSATAPPGAPIRATSAVARDAVFRHDVFNLIALGLLNLIHLLYATGAQDFRAFWWFTMAYFTGDFAWLVLQPACVKSPQVLAAHHVVAALFTLIPFFFPEHNDKMSYVMTVEVNTWLLIARRVMPSQAINLLFFASWVAIRNVLFPYLIWDFYLEYAAAAKQSGQQWHPVLLAPLLQAGLTLLNVQWTIALVKSTFRSTHHKSHQL